jgi:hypothetical protein
MWLHEQSGANLPDQEEPREDTLEDWEGPVQQRLLDSSKVTFGLKKKSRFDMPPFNLNVDVINSVVDSGF